MLACLRDEFRTPFALFDSCELAPAEADAGFPCELKDGRCAELVRSVLSAARAEVSSSDGSWLLLGLPVWKAGKIASVAVGAFHEADSDADFADTAPAFTSLDNLQQWAQAVADRVRLEDELRVERNRRTSVERQLEGSMSMLSAVGRLASRLRLSESPEQFQKLALATLVESLGVECVAWVPATTGEPLCISSQPVLDAARVRRLVTETLLRREPAEPCLIENDLAATECGRDYPMVRSVAVVSVDEKRPAGWLVALNKLDADFVPGDIALMRPVASLLNVSRKNLALYMDLKELLFGVVRALASAIDAKDPHTHGHSERVARIATCLGRHMKLTAEELSNLYLAGLLHDVGKIGVLDSVLKKPDKLTDSEYRHVMSHVEIGMAILGELKRLRQVLPGIRHHHERYGGHGYPDGIHGEEIPLIARILAVADSFDAMTSDRPYRPGISPDEVATILRRGAGKQWDPKVIDTALECWAQINAIRQRGLGESLRVAVDDALHQDYRADSTPRAG
jgi:HD-GYP domain-containing protein (c-di-GMP phosphodiesterase class II)